MCTSPTRHTRTFAQSPKKTICRHNASKNPALITDETLPYHKEGANRAVTLVGWEGGPMSGRSWAARCPELFAPGPDGCGGGGGATSLGRSAFCAAPATICAAYL